MSTLKMRSNSLIIKIDPNPSVFGDLLQRQTLEVSSSKHYLGSIQEI